MFNKLFLFLFVLILACSPLFAENTEPGAGGPGAIDMGSGAAFQAPTIDMTSIETATPKNEDPNYWTQKRMQEAKPLSMGIPDNSNSIGADMATEVGEDLILQQKMDDDIKEAKKTAKESQQSEKNKKLLKQISKHLKRNIQKGSSQEAGSSDSEAEQY